MRSRRAFVGSGATLAAVALAGCTSSPGESSETVREYRDLVAQTEKQTQAIQASKISTLATVDDFGLYSPDTERYGVAASEQSYAVEVTIEQRQFHPQSYSIYVGPWTTETVRSALEGTEEEPKAEFEFGGFTTLETDLLPTGRFYGIGEERLIVANERDRFESVVQTVNETKGLEIDENDHFAALAATIGNPDRSQFELEGGQTLNYLPAGAIGYGSGVDVAAGTSEVTVSVLFETADQAETSSRGAVRDFEDLAPSLDIQETERDGRSIIMRGAGETSQMFQGG